ncbi:MAG: MFS transporter, partial [Candidatus Marsarchaeota archaeon]|nr:MFS transporter [Candidatus Marsarchaeota archaeon]
MTVATESAKTVTSTQRFSRDFWKFWAGQTISNLGGSFTDFALPLLVFKLTGSPVD